MRSLPHLLVMATPVGLETVPLIAFPALFTFHMHTSENENYYTGYIPYMLNI